MSGIYRYNLYDADGRIVEANITKKELSTIIGTSTDTIRRHLLGIVSGQKERYREYTIECVLDGVPAVPYKPTKELLESEWDKTCKPFRVLRRNRNADDK